MSQLIHKVNIPVETVSDYEENFGLRLPKRAIRSAVEEYIPLMQKNGKLLYTEYFRLKFFDEGLDDMLLLFIRKGKPFGIMQMWDICGICLEDDWGDYLEDSGVARAWLNSPVDLTDISLYDWVVRHRVIEIIEIPMTYRLTGLTEEVKNAFMYGTDKELAEKLSFLEDADRRRSRRRTVERKGGNDRKLHKRTRRRKL